MGNVAARLRIWQTTTILGGLLLAGAAVFSGSIAAPAADTPCPARPAAPGGAADPPVPPLADYYLTPVPSPVLPSEEPLRRLPGPSMVEVRGEPYRYAYYVNGTRQTIHGMGYNVAYRLW